MSASEKLLVCVGLLLIAAGILFESFRVTEIDPATAIQTDPASVSSSSSVSRYAVNVNEATSEELAGVRGITEELAQHIVNERDENGPFTSAEDLTRVSGIGEKTLEQLRPYISVE